MLSVWAVSSASGGQYYQKEDYYLSSMEGGPETGLVWLGEGSKMLDLEGAVRAEDFQSVLRGRNPDPEGPPLSRAERLGEVDHKAGFDFTFSAPKSVSLLGLIGGDHRLLAAHEKAVVAAMSYAEKELAVTRIRTPEGKIERVSTGNLVAAKTTHATSREGDPQTHSHVIVANATWLKSADEWRAIESKALFEGQVALGLIYQRELARAAMDLGYDVQPHKGGTFELSAVEPEQREAFSKATKRVEEAYAREKPTTPDAAQVAKLKDRPKKLSLDVGELEGRWREEARDVGLDAEGLVKAAHERGRGALLSSDQIARRDAPIAEFVSALKTRLLGGVSEKYGYQTGEPEVGRDPEARRAVSLAVEVLEDRRAVFTRTEVMRGALEASSLQVASESLSKEIAALERCGVLKIADQKLHGGLTTPDALALERQLMTSIEAGKGKSTPAYDKIGAISRLKQPGRETSDLTLNAGQVSAALLVLSSKDRVLAIQGAAGVGKTTLMRTVNEALADKGVFSVGLGPTHAAVDSLRSEARMEKAQTTASFLAQFADVADGKRRATSIEKSQWTGKVVVVDEASMLSNRDAFRIVELSRKLELSKLVLVGDQRQLGAAGAGAPFRHLMNEGAPKAIVDEIVRQRDLGLRSSVEAFSQGNAKDGVERLGLSLIEVGAGKGSSDLVERAFQLWIAAHEKGQNRPVLTATQAERHEINGKILEHLERQGEIGRTGVSVSPLVQVHLTGPERWKVESYKEGQVLVFNSSSRQMDVSKDEQVHVIARGRADTSTLLHIESQDGRQFAIDLASAARNGRDVFSVFEPQNPKPIYNGAQMVFERSLKGIEARVGEKVTIVSSDEKQVTLERDGGARLELSANDPNLRFLGPGYAMTTHRAQGLTLRDDPIAVLHSRNANQAIAYVQVSRAVHGISVVTDSKERLLSKLSNKDGQNLIASENVRPDPAEMSPDRRAELDQGLREPIARDVRLESEKEKKLEKTFDRQIDGPARQEPQLEPSADRKRDWGMSL